MGGNFSVQNLQLRNFKLVGILSSNKNAVANYIAKRVLAQATNLGWRRLILDAVVFSVMPFAVLLFILQVLIRLDLIKFLMNCHTSFRENKILGLFYFY